MSTCTKFAIDHRSQCLQASEALPPFCARQAIASLALAAALLAAGCAKHARVAHAAPVGHTETGIASWYGEPYHGRKTASGEVYDMNRPTAAHRTLPFGTWVRVTNLSNAKRVEVRITDRGPFVDGRIIDLSRAAAKQIEMLGPGTTRVRLKVIRAPSSVRAAGSAAAKQTSAEDAAERRQRGEENE